MGLATVVGLALVVVGAVLIVLSYVPIPMVEVVPKNKSLESVTWTTVKQTIYEETFVVRPGSYQSYCVTFNRQVDLSIEVKVLQGGNRDINFWVMPESEFRVYKRGGEFRYYTIPSRQRVTEATISWSPPVGEEICFVYDNTFSVVTSKTVYSKIVATYLGPTTTTTYTTVYERETKAKTFTELLLPGIVLLIVGIGIAVGGAMTRRAAPLQYPAGYTP